MLNPSSNGESSRVVVKYVEEYLELVESLPLDLQRCVSIMKEIDARYQGEDLQAPACSRSVRKTNKRCIVCATGVTLDVTLASWLAANVNR